MKKTSLLLISSLSMLLALWAFTLPSEKQVGINENGYSVGDKATDFKLKNVDGKMMGMADDASAKGFIVTFTCNHCPYAKMYEDRIIALHAKYASKGYPVIAINPNDPVAYPEDSYESMQGRAKEKKYAFPYLLDETQEIAKKYGATKTPHIYIVQKEKGEFRVKYIGAIDNNAQDASLATEKYAEDAIDDLLAGREIKKNMTKAIGCSIKWKKA